MGERSAALTPKAAPWYRDLRPLRAHPQAGTSILRKQAAKAQSTDFWHCKQRLELEAGGSHRAAEVGRRTRRGAGEAEHPLRPGVPTTRAPRL